MKRRPGGGGLPLVRRAWWDGTLREFVHTPDGAAATEREPGAASQGVRTEAHAIARDRDGRPLMGQLVGREIVAEDAARPLHLPLLRASCEGTGACCSLYHHVPATTEDRDRIVALLRGTWDGPVPLEEVFHPAFDDHREGPLNIVDIDGGCAFSQEDGLCSVHGAGGPQSKPQGCLAFPAVLVACGDEWHASLRPECACVARTAVVGTPLDAEPAPWVFLRSTLVRAWEVPEQVRVTATLTIPRVEYVTWMRETMARLRTTFEPRVALADAIEALDGERPEPSPSPAWLAAVADELEGLREELRSTHAPPSAYLRSVVWGAETARALAEGASSEPAWSRGLTQHQARVHASVAAALLHGHALLEHDLLAPAATAMLRFLWLARASCAVRPAEEDDARLEASTTWIFLWRQVLEFPEEHSG